MLFPLLGGMSIPTHPNPTHPQWTVSKPVLFHEVFSDFPLLSLAAHSLTVDLHSWGTLITFHLYLSYVTHLVFIFCLAFITYTVHFYRIKYSLVCLNISIMHNSEYGHSKIFND